MAERASPTQYRGQAEARALSLALKASGARTPCAGMEPQDIDPALCSSCPVAAECLALGRASNVTGTFGGVRLSGGKGF